jgi:multidrug resistance protein
MNLRPSPAASSLVVVSAALFTDNILYFILVPLLPHYQRAFGLSQTDLGLLFACYAAALLLGTLPIARLCDRVGRRRVMLWGLLGLWGTTLLFAFGASFAFLMLARALQGLSAAATWTSGLALVADHWPEGRRGKALSTCFAFANLGTLLGPPFSGYVSENWGIRAPFVAAAGLALADALLRVWLLRDKQRGAAETIPLRRMLGNRSIVLLSCVIGVGAMSFALLESAMPIEFDARGWSKGAIGLAFASAALAHTLTSPVSGAMADRLSRKRMMVAGLLLLALLLPAPAFVHGMAPTFAIMACLGLVATLSGSPVAPAVTSAVDAMGAGGGGYSSAFGLINLTVAAGLMVGPLLGGAGVDLVGIKPSLLAFAAALALYALAIARFLPPEGRAAGGG